jgi:hypothetical protein
MQQPLPLKTTLLIALKGTIERSISTIRISRYFTYNIVLLKFLYYNHQNYSLNES